MDLLRRMMKGAEASCDCGHLPAVHWRSDDRLRMWCSAPGCSCNQVDVSARASAWPQDGDGFRLIERVARRRRSA